MALDDVKQSIISNVTNAYEKALDKGATEPENKNLENLADTIDSIKGGTTLGYHVRSVINPDRETQTLRIISGENLKFQDKTVTPSETETVVLPDPTYYAIEKVVVKAIPSDYVGSGVQKLEETAYTPTTSDIVVHRDQYLNGAQIIKGDVNLVPKNIAKDVELFGLVGTHEGGVQPTGTIQITENNKTYDVTNYVSANVNVPAVGTGLNELILMGKWIGSSDDPNTALGGETCFYFESNKHFTVTVDNVTMMAGEYTIDGQNVYLMDGAVVFRYDAETGLLIQEGESIVLTKVDVREGQPIKVSKETAMADLAEEFNVGNVFEFTGTSDTYETGALYIVSEV
jgi:hypothetical protein